MIVTLTMSTSEEAGLLLGIYAAHLTNKSPPLPDCDLFNSPGSPLNPPAPHSGQKTTISHSTSTYSSDDDTSKLAIFWRSTIETSPLLNKTNRHRNRKRPHLMANRNSIEETLTPSKRFWWFQRLLANGRISLRENGHMFVLSRYPSPEGLP